MNDQEILYSKSLSDLKTMAKTLGVKGYSVKTKDQIIEMIGAAMAPRPVEESQEFEEAVETEQDVNPATEKKKKVFKVNEESSAPKENSNPEHAKSKHSHVKETDTTNEEPLYLVEGILDKSETSGYGFLRFDNYISSEKDVYVAPALIKQNMLRAGDLVKGWVKPAKGKKQDNFGALETIEQVNGDDLERVKYRVPFEKLTPIFPNERINLEDGSRDLSMRLINLISPIGKGQRGLIVAQPKAGKTILLKRLANTIEKTHPECKLIVLLVDERPEEVTDFKRSIEGEVVYSTFDEKPEQHCKVTEMVLNRAKRLVEHQKDVVILLDSVTRLGRSYNLTVPPSGRTLSGGLDPASLYFPKKFFGAARNIEEGGSITILATALVDTGSKMDDVIFEEFKGTGNMEVHLDRKLSEKRIFPAIDLNKSGTRKEELLLGSDELEAVWRMRKYLGDEENQDAVESIIQSISTTANNKDFIERIKRQIK